MNLKSWLQRPSGRLSAFVLIYMVIALVMFWIIADDWSITAVETDAVLTSQLLEENAIVEQQFTARMDCLERLAITPHFNAQPVGSITLSLLENGTVLHEQAVDASLLQSDVQSVIPLSAPLSGVKGKELTLCIDPQNTGMSLWAGNTMNAGKFDVAVTTGGLFVNGTSVEANLVLTTTGHDLIHGSRFFWPAAIVLLVIAAALWAMTERDLSRSRRTPITMLVNVCCRYQFLIKQLVSRDFNVKYKSSMLGVLWSFLNPLLTMLVYLFVFSTIFRSDIEHFPVYLMSGIVLFNYFSESTSQGLTSITSNSALITKVYMPKLIYPLSKVLSSAVNLCISFIPLLIVMLITGTPFHKSMLLLPVVVMFLLMFSLGMSLLLSTMNVFFRDTQFLWGVLLTMLNFLSPVFYPESIIPAQFQTIYHLNPMYHILFFMRSIIIGGVSPTPVTYLYCLVLCGVPLALGMWIFRKNQDKFVLHL